MLATIWEAVIAVLSFTGASYVCLFATPKPPAYDRLGITLSSTLFALIGLYLACRVGRTSKSAFWILMIFALLGQMLIALYILQTPFFKI
jgi:hypothetical protein